MSRKRRWEGKMESNNFKELEDKIYSCMKECREEMKHHFFRFVELERRFQEITSKLIDLEIEFKINSPLPKKIESQLGKSVSRAPQTEATSEKNGLPPTDTLDSSNFKENSA